MPFAAPDARMSAEEMTSRRKSEKGAWGLAPAPSSASIARRTGAPIRVQGGKGKGLGGSVSALTRRAAYVFLRCVRRYGQPCLTLVRRTHLLTV